MDIELLMITYFDSHGVCSGPDSIREKTILRLQVAINRRHRQIQSTSGKLWALSMV